MEDCCHFRRLERETAPEKSRWRRRRRRRRQRHAPKVWLTLLALACVFAPTCRAFSFSSRRRRSIKGGRLYAQQSLSSLTVKELRQRIKDSSVERGVLSRLKKKRDLIEYLEGASTPSSESAPKNGGSKPLSMPRLETPEAPDKSTRPPSPKDAIFERVYQRYPPLRNLQNDNSSLDQPTVDIRQLYHPMTRTRINYNNSNSTITSGDMDIVFVGTASCTPGTTRGVSCTALRLNWNRRASFLDPSTGREKTKNAPTSFQGGTWLFDVGECTQLQIQRTSAIKPSKITKIFLTHAHGDHTFGLPGLLCLMGQDRDRENAPPVDIYGPEGLRMWLRVAIRYSVSRIVPPYRVHELKHVPMAPEWEFSGSKRRYFYRGRPKGSSATTKWPKKGLAGEDPTSWISHVDRMTLEPSPLYGEVDGGRDIYPVYDHRDSFDGAPVWQVEDEDDVKVFAAPMSHGIPCVGYVVEEQSRPGRLRNELVEPIVKRNVQALKEAGFNIPMKAMAVIKNLPVGSAFTFPDGTVLTQEDAVEPPRKGRKVVLCGDTADSRAMRGLAQNADVIIHECTNAYLQGVDRDTNVRAVTRDAIVHGHSTPQIGGEFCRAVNGKLLLLNHFSARYKGDTSVDSLSIMMRIELQAMKASGLTETQVAAAWDLMALPVSQH